MSVSVCVCLVTVDLPYVCIQMPIKGLVRSMVYWMTAGRFEIVRFSCTKVINIQGLVAAAMLQRRGREREGEGEGEGGRSRERKGGREGEREREREREYHFPFWYICTFSSLIFICIGRGYRCYPCTSNKCS